MPIQLTPEQVKLLSSNQPSIPDQSGVGNVAVNDSSTQPSSMANRGKAQSLTPEQARLLPINNEPIKREPEQQEFTGVNYEKYDPNTDPELNTGDTTKDWFKKAAVEGGVYTPPKKTEIDKRNADLYQKAGDSTLLNIPGGPRVQHTDEDGLKGTSFVPPPTSKPHEWSDDVSNIVVGGGLQALKSTAGFAEWAGDTLTHPFVTTAKLMGLIDKNQITPDQVNWASENIPTLPAQNGIDKMGQEIMSIVVGASTGGEIASSITKLPKVAQQITKMAISTLEKKGPTAALDMTNQLAKAQLVVKSALSEYAGANVGATITTPDATKPSPLGGSVSNQIPGLNQHDKDKVGNFIDNSAMSFALGKIFGFGAKVVGAGRDVFAAEGKSLSSQDKLTAHFLQQTDPDLVGLSPEEFARRAKVFADTVKVESKYPLGSLNKGKDFTLDPVTTMVVGAKSYVEKAYDYLKNTMPVNTWEEFVAKKSREVTDNVVGLRRDYMKSNIVASGSSIVNAKAKSILGDEADNIGDAGTTRQAGINLGTHVSDQLHQIQQPVKDAETNLNLAKGNEKMVSQTDPVLSSIYDKSNNGVIPSPTHNDDLMNRISTHITDNAVSAKADVDQTFASLPDTAPGGFNTKAVAQALKESGEVDNFKKLMNLPVHNPAIGAIGDQSMSDTAKGIKSPKTLKAEELSQATLKDLFTKGRPWVSDRIGDLTASLRNLTSGQDGTGIRAEISNLQNLKKVIDEQAAKYGGPEYQAALDKYSAYRDKFFGIEEQVPVSGEAIIADKSGFGGNNLLKNSRALVENAVSGGDQSGKLLEAVSNTLSDPNLTQDLANVVLDRATDAISLGSKDGYTTAKAMDQAIQPFMRTLNKLDPEAVARYTKARNAMAMAEAGSQDAEKTLNSVSLEATTKTKAETSKAAAQFLDQQGDSFMPKSDTGDIQHTFNKMFTDAGKTRQLLDLAKANGDETITKGIQNQYLRYLSNKLFTTKGLSADGMGAIDHESSLGFLKQFFSDADQSHRDVLHEVFKDNPSKADDIQNLLELVDISTGGRSVSPNTFNSRTVVDNERQKTMGLLITTVLGSLNPVATKVRGFSNRVTEALDRKDQDLLDRVIPSMIVDSDFLTQSIDDLVKNHTSQSLKSAAAKFLQRASFKGLTKGVPTTLKDESDYSKTDDALGNAKPGINITIPYGKK